MSLIGIFRNVKIQTELLLPLAVSFQKLLQLQIYETDYMKFKYLT